VCRHACVRLQRWSKVMNSDHRISSDILIHNFYTMFPSFFSLYTKLWLQRRRAYMAMRRGGRVNLKGGVENMWVQ